MWIQFDRDTDSEHFGTVAIRSDATLGERVEFTDTGKANVPSDVGESMIDYYDDIIPVSSSESDEDEDSDSDSDSDSS